MNNLYSVVSLIYQSLDHHCGEHVKNITEESKSI